MAEKNYYGILGVPRDASDAVLRKAYKSLALKHHPDRNADDQKAAGDKFKDISEAYHCLIDSQKRSNYDRYGHADGPRAQPQSRHAGRDDTNRAYAHGAGAGQESWGSFEKPKFRVFTRNGPVIVEFNVGD